MNQFAGCNVPKKLLSLILACATGLGYAQNAACVELPAGAKSASTPHFVIVHCQQIESGSELTSAERGMDPAGLISIAGGTRRHPIDPQKVKVQLLKGSALGALRAVTIDTGYTYYLYDPVPGFIGKEEIVFLGKVGGITYKIVSTVAVVKRADDREDQTVCPPMDIRKVTGGRR